MRKPGRSTPLERAVNVCVTLSSGDAALLRHFAALCLFALGSVLAGCNEAGPGGFAGRGAGRATPIALLSIDGAPPEIGERFQAALTAEARRRDLVLVENAAGARYTLKGYVTAYGAGGGTHIDWVWDLFDATQRRARRVNGGETVAKATSTDAEAWRALDEAALATLAARSMDGVVAFLDGEPDRSAGRLGEAAADGVVGNAGAAGPLAP